MKKGINAWSFPSGMGTKDCIKLASEIGYDGIELVLSETGELSLESHENEILGYREAAEEADIEISGLATGLYWLYSLTSNRGDIRKKARDIVRRQLDIAALLGTDVILVVPGSVGVDFRPEDVVPDAERKGFFAGSEVVDYDVAHKRALEAVRELAPYAQQKGIIIGVENVWNKFLLSPLEMRDFIDSINSKYVGVYLDVGNVMAMGYPEHWIKILGERIKRVHFKDYRRGTGGLTGFVDLLAGDVNFIEVVKSLNEIGYNGCVNAEMTPVYRNFPEQILYNTSRSLDKILGR